MTAEAPAAMALARSPENLIPPSAMTGISAALAASTDAMTAASCGTPTPATMRVVQMEPGPIPTLTASAPASISALVPSAVATLPAMMRTEFDIFLTCETASSTRCEWPCAVSTTRRSTPASMRRSARSMASAPTLMAAAARRRPCASLVALGFNCDFSISLTVMRPTQLPLASTTSSFSMRCLCSRWRASC
ncbi:hypothetical protein D3C80_1123290 [compost metagenome]